MQAWKRFTTDEIKPEGWLKKQLQIQAQGLAGNLDKMWRDVRDSSWIGGNADSWERVPYWLDGFIPLAYLLEDEDLIARAKKYIDGIVSFQQPDGWICPCSNEWRVNYDTWAVLLISKVLTVYYECSKDEKIIPVLRGVMKNFYDLLKTGKIHLFDWGHYRWFEGFIALNLLEECYPEGWVFDLAYILKKQGVHYPDRTELWKSFHKGYRMDTHIVNLAMMFKYEAVSADLLGTPYEDVAENLYQIMKEYNGTPVEIFTGDEHVGGKSPIHGSELCSVVELMYSYELLFAYTGNEKWLERLEVIAFNALPGTLSDDTWAHQYDQMSNQISTRKIDLSMDPHFTTNLHDAHRFGLEPNFGCCTANFGQGWPKFALSTYMHADGKIFNALPLPSTLKTEALEVSLQTEYPFKNEFTYTLSAKQDIEFIVRIPSFAKGVTVNGKKVKSEDISVKLQSGETQTLRVSYSATPRFEETSNGLTCVKCGSLVFSVPIEFEEVRDEYVKDGVERKYPYCDYEYIPKSDWNYAYASDCLEVEYRGVSEVPFSSKNPPVVIKTKVAPIDWGYEPYAPTWRGDFGVPLYSRKPVTDYPDHYPTVCAKTPRSTKPLAPAKETALYPYGCAKLRMTEIPKI